VLDRLVAIHRSTATVRDVALTDDFAIPGRDQLGVALTDNRSYWGPGPFAARAEQLLRQHGPDVETALARYDGLVAEVARSAERFVVTHGEPHRANTINTSNGVVLIDWDTALVAPPERDLWMLLAEEPAIAEDYTSRTGIDVQTAAVQLYRLCARSRCTQRNSELRTSTAKTLVRHGTGSASTSIQSAGGTRFDRTRKAIAAVVNAALALR